VGKMANRALLHMNKLKDFESWLEKQGYMILPTSKNPYEILRAKKSKDTVIIYRKGDSKEHLSIMDKDYDLIHKFMMESKLKTNADKIRHMSDEELTDFLSNITSQCESNTSCNQHCFGCDEEYCDLERCLKWLQSEAE
jgi:hypothetical protein